MSRYVPKTKPDPTRQQRWMTFLRNHKDVISGIESCVVPTVRFRLLYVWFAIDHGRRRILHFNDTENPTASWVIRPLRETFSGEPTHRYLIYDNDAIFSPAVGERDPEFRGRIRSGRPSEAHGRTEPLSKSSEAFAESCSIT